MIGHLTNEEMELFLKLQYIGRIGCHMGDEMYVVPISYVYDGNYIYCHTQEGMKINMMRKNPRVCFEIDVLEKSATWRSVILWGVFEELVEKEERKRALKILLNRVYPFISSKKMRLGEFWPFAPDDLDNIQGIVFRIKPEEKTGRFEINEDERNYVMG